MIVYNAFICDIIFLKMMLLRFTPPISCVELKINHKRKKESALFCLVWIKKLKARTTIYSIYKLLVLQERFGLITFGIAIGRKLSVAAL